MPIYEFHCQSCDRNFELLIGISRIHEATCPNCGSGDLKRAVSTFSSRTAGDDCYNHSGSSCDGCSSGQCATCGMH
ncbi:MAG: FmdB family zinc ribbon protein [Armatimonadota bacterium]|jgi:putative FmdB family regulatory protein